MVTSLEPWFRRTSAARAHVTIGGGRDAGPSMDDEMDVLKHALITRPTYVVKDGFKYRSAERMSEAVFTWKYTFLETVGFLLIVKLEGVANTRKGSGRIFISEYNSVRRRNNKEDHK